MTEQETEEMQWRDYRAMLQTRHQAATMLGMTGMEPWPPHKAARLMAIVQVFGNNEGFTLSPKFKADRDYIQELYHINGGEVPDQSFAKNLQRWVSVYQPLKDKDDYHFLTAARWIKQMYNFQLYV